MPLDKDDRNAGAATPGLTAGSQGRAGTEEDVSPSPVSPVRGPSLVEAMEQLTEANIPPLGDWEPRADKWFERLLPTSEDEWWDSIR